MAGNMPTEDSFPCLAHTLFSHCNNVFNSHRLRPEVLVDRLKNKLLDGYNGVQYAMSHYIPHAAPMIVTLESVDLQSVFDSNRQVTNTGQGQQLFRNHSNYFTSEAYDSDVEAARIVRGREYNANMVIPEQPKRSWMWMAAFIVGGLSLIVLPGLVVGVMTRQMSWGVELSGAIAPIVSLLAGLYYHHNK